MITININYKKSKATDKAISITLPASSYDLQDALEKLGVKNPSDCRIISVKTDVDGLNEYFDSHKIDMDDIPKLSLLSLILDSMDEYRLKVFSAVVYRDEPQTLDKLVCIASESDEADLDEDIYTKKTLGRSLINDGFIDIPEEVSDFVSYKKVANHYMDETGGALTPYGFIQGITNLCENCMDCYGEEVSEDVIEEMCRFHDKVVFHIAVAPRKKNKWDDSVSLLELPVTDDVLVQIEFLGPQSLNKLCLTDIRSRNRFFDSLFNSNTDIRLLNKLAKTIINMDSDAFLKYKAVLAYWNILSENSKPVSNHILGAMLVMADTLAEYEFIPKIGDVIPMRPFGKQTPYGWVICPSQQLQDYMNKNLMR